MKYYVTYPEAPVLHGDHNYRVVKVMKEDEKNFLDNYGHTIIASGRSVMEALVNLEVWKANNPGAARRENKPAAGDQRQNKARL